MASSMVKAFFEAACADDVPDAEVMDYLAGVLDDPDSLESTSLEDLDELICCNAPIFESVDKDLRMQNLIDLVEKIRSVNASTQQQQPGTSGMLGHPSTDSLAKQASVGCTAIHRTLVASSSNEAPDTSSQDDQEPSCCQVSEQDIQTLAELCPPSTGRDYLTRLLQHDFAGDVQRAAEWLVECADVEAHAEAWRSAEERARHAAAEEARAAERARKAVLQRFHLQVVPEGGAAKKLDKGLGASFAADKKAKGEPQVRYRDGQVVSKRGEKFIMETVGEEWDGGSKGKVYTKGKRGKGFL